VPTCSQEVGNSATCSPEVGYSAYLFSRGRGQCLDVGRSAYLISRRRDSAL
jgi:hypothetical protein